MNFLQVIVNSLPQMAIYSLATIGIVLIFRTTGTTNFAQGLIATFGTFMTTQMALYAGLPLWLGLIIGMAVAFLLGIFMDVVLIRNARKINASGKQMITMGMLLILSYVIPVIFKNISSNGNLGEVFESGPLSFNLFGISLTIARNYVYVIILAILLLAVVFICLKFTKWGLGVRATASNEVVSQMLGINTKVITAFSWAISGALATIAGVFQAGGVALNVTVMSNVQVFGFLACVLGGFNSFFAPIIGTIIIPLLYNIFGSLPIKNAGMWQTAMTFVVVMILILIFPNGLLGKKTIKKV